MVCGPCINQGPSLLAGHVTAALLALDHGGSPFLFVPLLLAGVFLEARFAPTAVVYLARCVRHSPVRPRPPDGVYVLVLGLGGLAA